MRKAVIMLQMERDTDDDKVFERRVEQYLAFAERLAEQLGWEESPTMVWLPFDGVDFFDGIDFNAAEPTDEDIETLEEVENNVIDLTDRDG